MRDINRFQDPAGWIIENALKRGLEWLFRRYYGTYRGIVVDNEDPENRLRIRAQIPAIGHRTIEQVPTNIWALPNLPGLASSDGKCQGMFAPPEVGDPVWVQFEYGLPEKPIYTGGWLKKDHEATEFATGGAPTRRGFRTRSGHYLQFREDDGDVSIILAKGDGDGSQDGTYFTMLDNGSVVLSTSSGSLLYMDAESGDVNVVSQDGSVLSVGKDRFLVSSSAGQIISADGDSMNIISQGDLVLTAGGKIALASNSIDIGNGAVEPAVLGNQLGTLYSTHVHTSGGPGSPTTPQVGAPPVPGNGLSTKVRIA